MTSVSMVKARGGGLAEDEFAAKGLPGSLFCQKTFALPRYSRYESQASCRHANMSLCMFGRNRRLSRVSGIRGLGVDGQENVRGAKHADRKQWLSRHKT